MDHYLRKLKNFYLLASVGRAIRTQLQPIVLEPLPKRIAALARKLGIIAPRTPEATKKDDNIRFDVSTGTLFHRKVALGESVCAAPERNRL
jgi:hypothetical protein